jgi:MFS family permease
MLNPVAPFRAALRHRNLRILFAGQAASDAGDWLYNVALLALVYERTGSSALLGATTAARMLPLVVLGPLGGVLADRLDRRRLMIGSDVLRAACMAALAAVALTDAPIILAPVLAALCTAAGAAYPPCVLSLIPRLASDQDLPAANAARVTIMHACIMLGPVLGAGLLVVGPTAVAFVVNGATFLAGAAAVAALPREALHRPAASAAHAGLRSDLAGGWRALRAYPDAAVLVSAEVLASAVYGALTVLFVLLSERLGLGSAGYGYLMAALGIGAVLSAGIAGRAADSPRPRRAMAAAVVLLGAPLPIAMLGWLPGVLLIAVLAGAGSLVSEVVGDTALQRSLDPAVFARVYGLVLPASLAGIALGALLAPLCVDVVGLDGTLIVIAAVCAAYAIAVAATRSPVWGDARETAAA